MHSTGKPSTSRRGRAPAAPLLATHNRDNHGNWV
ncbi:MAG: thioredoxin [Prochlorothrix sp.]|nr:thioredoxin [Prochlorothrix sp.]